MSAGQVELIGSLIRPRGALVALAEVYVDESGTQEGSPVLCVAGYVFYRRHAIEFTRRFSHNLKSKKVEFWHSTDCNPDPGNGPCKGVSGKDRTWLQTQLIQKTRKYTQYGFAVTVNENEYNEVFANNHAAENAYSWLLWMALTAVLDWIHRTNFNGQVSYIFEAGHPHQASANELMNKIFLDEEMRADFRYAQHGFSPKKCAVPLQCADLLAWHWFVDFKKRLDGKPRRKDLEALIVSNRDVGAHFTKGDLEEHAHNLSGEMRLLQKLRLAGFAG